MRKGQITIEYIIVLVILLILFTNISMDFIEFSTENTLKLQTENMVTAQNNTLQNAIEMLSLQGTGAKQTILLDTPIDCGYEVTSSQLRLNCSENSSSKNYDGVIIGKTSGGVSYEKSKYIEPSSSDKVTLKVGS